MGSKVEINYHGQGKYYPGHVVKASDEGAGLWDVLYDDGDTETRVPSHHLRLLAQVFIHMIHDYQLPHSGYPHLQRIKKRQSHGLLIVIVPLLIP